MLRLPDLLMILSSGLFAGTAALVLWRPRGHAKGDSRTISRRRERALETSIPDALDALASCLSAGFSLQQALDEVGRESSQRLAPLFSEVMTSVSSGSRLEEALRQTASRFSGSSFPLVFLSLASACRSGANTVESLNHLARVCRDRQAIRLQVAAKTAQGRMQGMILMFVPVLFLIALFLVSPSSTLPVLQSPLGRAILLVAVVLQTLGAWSIRVMVNRELI